MTSSNMTNGFGCKLLKRQYLNGRGERIRTSDPLVPNQVRYQTALRPELCVRCRWRMRSMLLRPSGGGLLVRCTDLVSLAEFGGAGASGWR